MLHMLRDTYRTVGTHRASVKTLLAAGAFPIALGAFAGETIVRSQADYQRAIATVQPGDTIVLADGEWRDFEVLFAAKGTEDRPITLEAETKGQVILSGQSNLRVAGEHLIVSGLVFRNGHTPTSEVIAFRRNRDELANHTRITEVVIDHFNNPERFEVDLWVAMYGRNNRFDHSHLVGKSNRGVTMAVRLDTEASRSNRHRIDHNYFGPRQILGSNGGETLRIGTSHYAHTDSLTVVENNYFDRCNGEVEIVSSKSGGNVFRGNLFFESRGTLTLRHGDNNLVENNIFLGNRVPHTGGIRIINRNQTVRNNYLHGLTGYRFGSALTVMNGVPNSPANRYVQVDGAVIEHNTIIDSDHLHLGAGSDEERSAPPINSVFRNNLVYLTEGDPFTVFDDVSGIKFSSNLANKVGQPAIKRGFLREEITLEPGANELLYPSDSDLDEYGVRRGLKRLDKRQTGVRWYPKPESSGAFGGGKSISVKPSEGALYDAIAAAGAGDTLILSPGTYVMSKVPRIDSSLSIRSATVSRDSEPNVTIEFQRSALFELGDGGSLELNGLHISGRSAPDNAGNSVLRTRRYSMLNNYRLRIDRCLVTHLNVNHSFNFLTVAKHTFADSITIENSEFRDVSGHILQLDREVDDLGIYNSEAIQIKDSVFENIGGTVANVYRGGTDESTFGPQLRLQGSTLRNVGHARRNKTKASLMLHGVQVTAIEGNKLIGSQPIRVVHTVGEPKTTIARNELSKTAPPIVRQHGSPSENCQCESSQGS